MGSDDYDRMYIILPWNLYSYDLVDFTCSRENRISMDLGVGTQATIRASPCAVRTSCLDRMRIRHPHKLAIFATIVNTYVHRCMHIHICICIVIQVDRQRDNIIYNDKILSLQHVERSRRNMCVNICMHVCIYMTVFLLLHACTRSTSIFTVHECPIAT